MKFTGNLCSLVVLVICIGNVLAGDSADGRPRSCPGGYADGTQMEIDRYWYECHDGQRIPKGCLTNSGSRISIDETFETEKFRMKCIKVDDVFMTFTYVGCVHKGTGHDIGAQWDDGTAFYTCDKEGTNVRVTTLGCIDQGRQVRLDERVAKGDFMYKCILSVETPTMKKVGCVHEGRKYKFGATIEGTTTWFTCLESGAKITGCLHESRKFNDGDYLTNGDSMYQCKIKDDGSSTMESFACLQREEAGSSTTIERRVGCFWVEGSGAEAYQYTCKEDSANRLAKLQTKCVYRHPRGTFMVDPGCIRLSPIGAVGCHQNGDRLKIEVHNSDQVDSIPGLRRCE